MNVHTLNFVLRLEKELEQYFGNLNMAGDKRKKKIKEHIILK